MIDTPGPAAAAPFNFKALAFFTIQLSPLADGSVFIAMTATSIDDQEAQLLNQEIASQRVATLDEALAIVVERVRATSQPPQKGKDH